MITSPIGPCHPQERCWIHWWVPVEPWEWVRISSWGNLFHPHQVCLSGPTLMFSRYMSDTDNFQDYIFVSFSSWMSHLTLLLFKNLGKLLKWIFLKILFVGNSCWGSFQVNNWSKYHSVLPSQSYWWQHHHTYAGRPRGRAIYLRKKSTALKYFLGCRTP